MIVKSDKLGFNFDSDTCLLCGLRQASSPRHSIRFGELSM